MTFYLKPPRGNIAWHILQKCVEERLNFFNNGAKSGLSGRSMEYLFEDSALDRAGHFTLRLAAVTDPGFLIFFVSSEVNLLELRLNSYNEGPIRTFLKTTLRHAKECVVEDGISENITAFLNVLIAVAAKMLNRSYCAHVFNQAHARDDRCKLFKLNVPFQYCTPLVAQRLVELKNGYAKILCENWKKLLLSLYHTYLNMAVKEMHYSKNVVRALEDDRIKSILLSINIQKNGGSYVQMSLNRIDQESKYFPLCMQNLQVVLKKNHRLGHEERFNLSLFLKDVGFSVHDSISYWKEEYSKEHNCTKCTHSWQKDEKRYMYSIRHLYGLEGSRKTYKTRSCGYFQNVTLSPRQEGGCPFKHFDSDKLEQLLCLHLEKDSDDVGKILLERNASPLGACKLFLNVVSSSRMKSDDSDSACSSSTNCDISFNNPVQYFVLFKNFLE